MGVKRSSRMILRDPVIEYTDYKFIIFDARNFVVMGQHSISDLFNGRARCLRTHKSAEVGDNTKFKHVDVNIQDYLDTGRGGNILQGTVSLTQEDKRNCTTILKGMHKTERLTDWWNSVKTRGGGVADGLISGIEPHMWTEDEEKYGIRWTNEVCGIADVRVSLPFLPHGSTGPATTVRRTILPWYTAVQGDHETLDCAEADT